MMMKVLSKDIKEFSKEWKTTIKQGIEKTGLTPMLGILQVGEDMASSRYVRNKIKDCEEVGIITCERVLHGDITTEIVVDAVKDLVWKCDGVIVQLPLPKNISLESVKRAIPATKDVDGFRVDSLYKPCTPLGILSYLDACGYDLDGKNVTIFGRSEIVGKPLAKMMTDRNATVTLCHSHTKNYYQFIQTADLIVTAVGKPKFLNCYPIHIPVIDVGINFIEGEDGKMHMVGDCCNIENRDVTPVPGGVGLLTRCALLENVWQAANINLDDHVRREQKLFSCKNLDDPQCSMFCPQFDYCKEKEKENK